jgi:hypothetical protein
MSEPYWVPLGAGAVVRPNPSARVFHNANQSIPNGATTALAFNSERFDTDGIHDPATNPTRLTCRTAGKYVITGECVLANSQGGTARQLFVRLNGGTIIAGFNNPPIGAASAIPNRMIVSTIWELAVGDYIELCVYHDSGAALAAVYTEGETPEFSMVRVDTALPGVQPGLALIEDKVIVTPSISHYFNNVPQNYKHLLLFWDAICEGGTDQAIYMQLNNDGTNNYDWQESQASGTTITGQFANAAAAMRIGVVAGSVLNTRSSGVVEIPNYTGPFRKSVVCRGGTFGNANRATNGYGQWRGGAAITQVIVYNVANFIANSRFTLYGVA